jgi:16S rRNA (cytosine967-C5)-methyltransferase
MHPGRIIEQAIRFIEQADVTIPVHRQLSHFFSANRAMGSRDRRYCRSLVYAFFRLGKSLQEHAVQVRVATAAWLMNELPLEFIVFLLHDANLSLPEIIPHEPEERFELVKTLFPEIELTTIFPCHEYVSSLINKQDYIKSMMIQPLVWIRIRSNKLEHVVEELKQHRIIPEVVMPNEQSMGFRSGSSLDKLAAYQNGFFEIQDLASRRTARFLHPEKGQRWWDVCAASGGKSLLLLDQVPDLSLLATDVRSSILANYTDRLARAGYHHAAVKQWDVSVSSPTLETTFHGILADVPCSGSGTWSRTPEQLVRFEKEKIKSFYVPLQRSIVENSISRLENNGLYIYITCSVFSSENEENVNWMVDRFRLEVVAQSYISCYFDRADTMFVAVLRLAP